MNVNKFIGITYDVIDALGLFVVSNKNEQRNSKILKNTRGTYLVTRLQKPLPY